MKVLASFFLTVALSSSVLLSSCVSTDTYTFPSAAFQDLPVLLGHQDGCRVSATDAPQKGSHGKIRLYATSVTSVLASDLYSGRSLTIAQVLKRVSNAFGDAGQAPKGKKVGQLGSLQGGGEASFIADGKGGVAIVYSGNDSGKSSYSASQVKTLKTLIDRVL